MLKKVWFLLVLLFCGVSFGQTLDPTALPDPFLTDEQVVEPLTPVADPISTPGLLPVPTMPAVSCAELHMWMNVFVTVQGALMTQEAEQAAELADLDNQIMDKDGIIQVAINVGASQDTLRILVEQRTALAAARAVVQAKLDATRALLLQCNLNIMNLWMDITFSGCF